jgi:alkylation response protein AidB-like acyl-CoA dehydrogenase
MVVERDDTSEGKLGLRAAHTGAVRLMGVQVPEQDRLAGAAEPLALHRGVALCRLTLAGVALGTARACLAYALGWARTRSAFGREIASYQGVSFVLADLRIAIESATLLVGDTATGLADMADVAAIEAATGRAVARACAAATEAGRTGINVLGVHGIVTEHPVERWYRAAATLSAVDFDPLTVALDVA